MDEKLAAKIAGKLEVLSDEVGRQLLDYVEFLQSKYNKSSRERTTLERIAENIEGSLGVKGPSQVIDTAESVVRGVAAAGRAVVEGFQGTTESSGADRESAKESAPSTDEDEKEEPQEQTATPPST
ncbi:MAG: hypothetical protein ACE5HT_05900 [Gemmatimonadales bacterium]